MDDTTSKLELALEVSKSTYTVAVVDQITSKIVANSDYEELRFRRGSPLACGEMDFVCSSFIFLSCSV